jgi:hypothetical protein
MTRSRRCLVLTFICGIAALSCALPAPGARAEAPLELLFADPGAARRLGRRVLQATPACRTAAAGLARELATAGGSVGSLRAELARRVRSDFAHDRVMLVDGWVLARSEALACAALAL